MHLDESRQIAADESAPSTRCRIMATASTFFHEIGYQKTTVADIARALKMSPANVYRFFDSKKAINEAVLERLIGEVEALLAGIANRPGSRPHSGSSPPSRPCTGTVWTATNAIPASTRWWRQRWARVGMSAAFMWRG